MLSVKRPFCSSTDRSVLQALQRDKVRVIFKNEPPEPSSLRWHSFDDQIGAAALPTVYALASDRIPRQRRMTMFSQGQPPPYGPEIQMR